MRAIAVALFVACAIALAPGVVDACEIQNPSVASPPAPGWAPVPTGRVRPPGGPNTRSGRSLLAFGVMVSGVLGSIVALEKRRLRRRRLAIAVDPMPTARVVRR